MPSQPARHFFQKGELFEQNYRIVRELGRGGFGVIYLANQLSMERPVALKVLRPDLAALGATPRKRFLREIKIISKLRHPNTVTIYDYGQTSNNILYMVLEYVDGLTLQAALDRHGPQSPMRSLGITRQIARSLTEAHSHDVIHRDLKPDNIMLTDLEGDGDFVKVLDFGVARLRGNNSVDLTSVGVPDGQRSLMGTPRYMSPEQVRGEDLTAAADIYSLGLLCYEMVAGEPAVSGETVLDMIRQQNSPEPLPLTGLKGVPPQFADLIRRATEKSIAHRFGDGDQLVAAIDETARQLSQGTPDISASSSQEFLSTSGQFSAIAAADDVTIDDPGVSDSMEHASWSAAAFSAEDFQSDFTTSPKEEELFPELDDHRLIEEEAADCDDANALGDATSTEPATPTPTPPTVSPPLSTPLERQAADVSSHSNALGLSTIGLCLLGILAGAVFYVAFLIIAAFFAHVIDGQFSAIVAAAVLAIIPIASTLYIHHRDGPRLTVPPGGPFLVRVLTITTVIASGAIVIISFSRPAPVTYHLRGEQVDVGVHGANLDTHYEPPNPTGLHDKLSFAVAGFIERSATAVGRLDPPSTTEPDSLDPELIFRGPPAPTRPGTGTLQSDRDHIDATRDRQPVRPQPHTPPPTRPGTRGDHPEPSDTHTTQ